MKIFIKKSINDILLALDKNTTIEFEHYNLKNPDSKQPLQYYNFKNPDLSLKNIMLDMYNVATLDDSYLSYRRKPIQYYIDKIGEQKNCKINRHLSNAYDYIVVCDMEEYRDELDDAEIKYYADIKNPKSRLVIITL